MKQREMSAALKAVTLIGALLGLGLILVLLPKILTNAVAEKEITKQVMWMLYAAVIVLAIPCYLSFFRFWQICTRIGKDNSFSNGNAFALKRMSQYMIAECILLILALFLLGYLGLLKLPLLAVLLLFVFICAAVAVAAAALSHLVWKAVELKQEQELTI